VTPWSVN